VSDGYKSDIFVGLVTLEGATVAGQGHSSLACTVSRLELNRLWQCRRYDNSMAVQGSKRWIIATVSVS